MEREKKIIRTSIIGIIANAALAAFKAVVGILSNSIAITLDAVNNLSDALSSVITIIGTRLALKAPDKKHPYGYGRIEYLSASVISCIVLYAGITSLKESVSRIIHPEAPSYSLISIMIISVAVLVKIILGRFVKKAGEETDSDSLINSGADALNDAVLSSTTVASALIYVFLQVDVSAWLGVLIAVMIVKSGFEMLNDTISRILGDRAEHSVSQNIKKTVNAIEGVHGVFDVVVHDYGPARTLASLHIQVPDTTTANEIDRITRKITDTVFEKNHIIVTAVGIYAENTTDIESMMIQNRIMEKVRSHDGILQVHGFYVNEKEKEIRFDIIIDFAYGTDAERINLYQTICQEVKDLYPDFRINIQLDTDVSD